ncbi:pyrroloquinoline quinone biosynthesis peptide chaperone PqqD [Spiribacter onubensis]|uniref:Pyrroloquinoline quinone biosynthesis peptide chaperone PqqD n=1 Tax=Spiribacter onubensis TaxID=3122420 RepID=A0ABV3S7U0_9GAMM
MKLRLGTGMRLQWEAAQSAYVMLYPEGMIRLNEPAGHILSRCDGRTVDALITDLEAMFPDAELADDVIAFLDEADAKGWLRTEGEDHG